jgi:hypothetical protein
VVYVHKGVLFGHKEEMKLFHLQENGWKKIVMSSEISQTEKKKCHMFCLIWGIYTLKKEKYDMSVEQGLCGVGILWEVGGWKER